MQNKLQLGVLILVPISIILLYLEQWDAIMVILATVAFFIWSIDNSKPTSNQLHRE
ncbi:hypothetical protein QUF64_14010 [Anaerolineales bacterium HSG6]|nr:hypothetical protein [Anaerolineales bacterium HSG6]MDM8530933.1 hypothetical protein [Anaerolineales bacterium HSG25]